MNFILKIKIFFLKFLKFYDKKVKRLFLILFIETIYTIIQKPPLIYSEKYIYDIYKRYDFNIYIYIETSLNMKK